ncbi:MAG: hypothetical protein N2B06_08570, partial [Clostridium sp.]
MKNDKIISIFIMVSISILAFIVFSAIKSPTSNPQLSLTAYSDTTTFEEKDHDRTPSSELIAHNP